MPIEVGGVAEVVGEAVEVGPPLLLLLLLQLPTRNPPPRRRRRQPKKAGSLRPKEGGVEVKGVAAEVMGVAAEVMGDVGEAGAVGTLLHRLLGVKGSPSSLGQQISEVITICFKYRTSVITTHSRILPALRLYPHLINTRTIRLSKR